MHAETLDRFSTPQLRQPVNLIQAGLAFTGSTYYIYI